MYSQDALETALRTFMMDGNNKKATANDTKSHPESAAPIDLLLDATDCHLGDGTASPPSEASSDPAEPHQTDTILRLLASQPPHLPAIRTAEADGIKPATYGDLHALVSGFRSLLTSAAFNTGDCAVSLVDDGPLAATLFLCLSSYAKAAPLSPGASQQEILDAVLQLGPKAVFTTAKHEAVVAKVIAEAQEHNGAASLPTIHILEPLNDYAGAFELLPPPSSLTANASDHGTHQATEELRPNGLSSVAVLLRTSGTTSRPKVVPLTLGAIVRNGGAIASNLGLQREDVCINAMPLFHIGGISASVLATLSSGGSVLCMPGFTPASFAKALCSGPDDQKPTWYSAVPTIHLALLQYMESFPGGPNAQPHRLRFIRSGAAALSHESAVAMREAWACPVIPSYSMTECMPISQCPAGYDLGRPNSVGSPLTGLKIISAETGTEAPAGTVGEICISGPNVTLGYVDNEEANAASFVDVGGVRYFRTGDLGYLDVDRYLFLSGRAKELIKVGGEQVSPFEVEAVLHKHPSVQIALAYGIPNRLLGEVTGAVVVLVPHDEASADQQRRDAVLAELRDLCASEGLSSIKIPRLAVAGSSDELPKGPTGKFLRGKLAEQFNGADGTAAITALPEQGSSGGGKTAVLSDATVGIRFILSLIVCLNHIGDHAWPSEGSSVEDHTRFSAALTSMRVIGDTGVVMFGMLAGFSLVASMQGAMVEKGRYFRFYESRLVPIHLIYLIACALCIINRAFSCRPEDFGPYVFGSTDACRATVLDLGYYQTWALSIGVMLLTLQAWPIGVLVWHISYYTWFSSAYQACIFSFPYLQRLLSDKARRGRKVLYLTHFSLQVVHFLTLVLMEAVYLTQKAAGNLEFVNYWVWAGYMFPPFWIVRFACGCMLGYHFLESRPDRRPEAWKWGVATDLMTLGFLLCYVLMISFGVDIEVRFSHTSLLEDRMYCGVVPRLAVPIFMFYIYGLAVGKGITCRILSSKPLVALSPAAYAIYLLHQPVFEWWSYFMHGEFWMQRKPFEWFSPDPIVLDWAETIVVIFLTVKFSVFVTWLVDNRLMSGWLRFFRAATSCFRGLESSQNSADSTTDVEGGDGHGGASEKLVLDAIEDLVGLRPALTDRPAELLASLGIVALRGALESRNGQAKLSPIELMECDTVADIVVAVEARISEASEADEATKGQVAAPVHLRVWRWFAGHYVVLPEHGQSSSQEALQPPKTPRSSSPSSSSSDDGDGAIAVVVNKLYDEESSGLDKSGSETEIQALHDIN